MLHKLSVVMLVFLSLYASRIYCFNFDVSSRSSAQRVSPSPILTRAMSRGRLQHIVGMSEDKDISTETDTSTTSSLPPLPKKGTSPAQCPFHPECGCDGLGKMQGGIATYPFFGWWPIKVYRPCPSYVKAGYIYKREGQTMDQVLFSEPSSKMVEKMLVFSFVS